MHQNIRFHPEKEKLFSNIKLNIGCFYSSLIQFISKLAQNQPPL